MYKNTDSMSRTTNRILHPSHGTSSESDIFSRPFSLLSDVASILFHFRWTTLPLADSKTLIQLVHPPLLAQKCSKLSLEKIRITRGIDHRSVVSLSRESVLGVQSVLSGEYLTQTA